MIIERGSGRSNNGFGIRICTARIAAGNTAMTTVVDLNQKVHNVSFLSFSPRAPTISHETLTLSNPRPLFDKDVVRPTLEYVNLIKHRAIAKLALAFRVTDDLARSIAGDIAAGRVADAF